MLSTQKRTCSADRSHVGAPWGIDRGEGGADEVRVVEQASGLALNRTDYGVQMAVLDHHKGVVVLFIDIRQNSFCGH
jgi:hypothetical protein